MILMDVEVIAGFPAIWTTTKMQIIAYRDALIVAFGGEHSGRISDYGLNDVTNRFPVPARQWL